MKSLLTLSLIAISTFVSAQTISESLKSIREKYNPIFGNKSATLSIDFIRQYEFGTTDYSYFLVFKVNNESLEKESVSLGYSLLSSSLISGSIASGGSNFSVKRSEGEVVLNKAQLIELYDCGNIIYKHINDIKKIAGFPETLALCEIEGVSIGAELYNLAVNGTGTKFYFRLGETSVFEMDKGEFERIMASMGWMKRNWPDS